MPELPPAHDADAPDDGDAPEVIGDGVAYVAAVEAVLGAAPAAPAAAAAAAAPARLAATGPARDHHTRLRFIAMPPLVSTHQWEYVSRSACRLVFPAGCELGAHLNQPCHMRVVYYRRQTAYDIPIPSFIRRPYFRCSTHCHLSHPKLTSIISQSHHTFHYPTDGFITAPFFALGELYMSHAFFLHVITSLFENPNITRLASAISHQWQASHAAATAYRDEVRRILQPPPPPDDIVIMRQLKAFVTAGVSPHVVKTIFHYWWLSQGRRLYAAMTQSMHLMPSHPIPSHPIPSHPIPSHFSMPSHTMPCHPMPSHAIPSHAYLLMHVRILSMWLQRTPSYDVTFCVVIQRSNSRRAS